MLLPELNKAFPAIQQLLIVDFELLRNCRRPVYRSTDHPAFVATGLLPGTPYGKQIQEEA
jgi:hypothetical protein